MSTATRAPSQSRMARSPTSLSRPTTPLRPSSRSSLRASHQHSTNNALAGSYNDHSALDVFEPQFAELADSMADLEANLMHLQLMHESLSRFSESFASFLYGLNMNAFVVDFPEVRSQPCLFACWVPAFPSCFLDRRPFLPVSCSLLTCSRPQSPSRLPAFRSDIAVATQLGQWTQKSRCWEIQHAHHRIQTPPS